MRLTDKFVLLALPLAGLVAAFWFLVLSPKREEAASLGQDVIELQAAVAEQRLVVEAAEAARETFPATYRRLVVLGKAVPEGPDTSSLLVQLTRNAASSGVNFASLNLVPAAAGPAPAPPPPVPTTPATAAEESEQAVANAEAGDAPAEVTPTQVIPTETAVASLPIGATVGPAGLPVMPYELGFQGEYFAIADFIDRLDSQVGLNPDGRPSVFGRLITIDGFTLSMPDSNGVEPGAPTSTLDAQFAVTTFLTPSTEGLTAGATPAGPVPAQPQPVSVPAVPSAPPVASVGSSIPVGGAP